MKMGPKIAHFYKNNWLWLELNRESRALKATTLPAVPTTTALYLWYWLIKSSYYDTLKPNKSKRRLGDIEMFKFLNIFKNRSVQLSIGTSKCLATKLLTYLAKLKTCHFVQIVYKIDKLYLQL